MNECVKNRSIIATEVVTHHTSNPDGSHDLIVARPRLHSSH